MNALWAILPVFIHIRSTGSAPIGMEFDYYASVILVSLDLFSSRSTERLVNAQARVERSVPSLIAMHTSLLPILALADPLID